MPTHQSVIQLVTKADRTGLKLEPVREQPSSCDVIGGRRVGPTIPRPYQHARRREIKWSSDKNGQAGTSVHADLSDRDMWHYSRMAVMHY